jgi:uncharacterized protein
VSPKVGSEEATQKRAKRAHRLKCPICGKPPIEAYRPFCSKACADIDLGRWLSGRYVVPGEPVTQEADEEAED